MSMAETITSKLNEALNPLHFVLRNDSARHAGHAGDNGSGESHFHLTIVSDSFEGQARIARQRMIYTLLAKELSGSLHALSIKALTPDEYKEKEDL